jgi:hypothetical protein
MNKGIVDGLGWVGLGWKNAMITMITRMILKHVMTVTEGHTKNCQIPPAILPRPTVGGRKREWMTVTMHILQRGRK